MTLRAGNMFEALPDAAAGEGTDTLLDRPGLRIERIVSRRHASPPGFWYDQPHDEWVVVLQGTAELTIAGEAAPRRLDVGDHLFLPARCRHRVERTEDPTLWLAVHVG